MRVDRLHPIVLFVYFVGALGLSMVSMHPLWLGLSFLGSVGLYALLHGFSKLIRQLLRDLPFALIVMLTNPLLSHNGVTPLFYLNGSAITLEALLYGLALGMLLVTVLLWCQCYSALMSAEKFLWLFARILPRTALLCAIAMRMLPAAGRSFREMTAVQTSMGLYRTDSWIHRLQSSFRVLGATISLVLEQSMDTAVAMKARGYATGERTSYSIFRFSKADGVWLGMLLLLLGGVLFGVLHGSVTFWFYPALSLASPTISLLWTCGGFALLLALPLFLEGWEWIRWR